MYLYYVWMWYVAGPPRITPRKKWRGPWIWKIIIIKIIMIHEEKLTGSWNSVRFSPSKLEHVFTGHRKVENLLNGSITKFKLRARPRATPIRRYDHLGTRPWRYQGRVTTHWRMKQIERSSRRKTWRKHDLYAQDTKKFWIVGSASNVDAWIRS